MCKNLIVWMAVIITLVYNSGCIQSNTTTTSITEQEKKALEGACSTTVVGTLPPYTNIEFDESSFYFYDKENFRICKLDKNSGELKSQSIETSGWLNRICMDSVYLYVYGGYSSSVYRIDKFLNSKPELLVSFERRIIQLEAGGNRLYVELELPRVSDVPIYGLFKYDISEKILIELPARNCWYDADRDNVYWCSNDTAGDGRILWKMPHNASKPIVLAKGKLWDEKMMDAYIYCWDENENLLRISKQNGLIEKVLSDPVGFNEDNGYVLDDEIMYVTDPYDATFSAFHIKNPQKSFVILAKKGRFDDDDMNCWLWNDKDAFYWVAGPEEGSNISDEQWGTLFKTVVYKE